MKGVGGDAINAMLAAAAMNFQKLLRAVGRHLVCEVFATLSRLQSLWNSIGTQMPVQIT
jgi:hypothetical protein